MSHRFQEPALARRSAVAAGLALLAVPFWAAPASAHHLMELFHLNKVTPLAGLLSGIGHPLLGPDHLLFLLALGLVRRVASSWSAQRLRLAAGLLMGIGGAFAWTTLVP